MHTPAGAQIIQTGNEIFHRAAVGRRKLLVDFVCR